MKLPILKDVFAKAYNSTAFPLSILLTDSKKFLPFVLNTYIQVIKFYEPNERTTFFNFYFNNSYFHWNCFEMQAIRKHYFSQKISFLEKMIEDNLDKGFYIIAYINEYHIEGRRSYLKWNYLHDSLVYGYDDTVFYIMGYNDQQIYESVKIDKSQYYKALFDHPDDDYDDDLCRRLFMIRPKKNFIEDISILRLKNLLSDYVRSENNMLVPSSDHELRRTHSFGIQAFKELFEEIKETKEIDLRFIRLFYEHKVLMCKRIEYLENSIEINPSILIRYKEVEKESSILFSLCTKNSIKKDKDIVRKVCTMGESVVVNEKIILTELIECLALYS